MAQVMPIVDLVFEGLEEVEANDASHCSWDEDKHRVDEAVQSSVFNASALVSDDGVKKSLLQGASEVLPGLYVGSVNDVEAVRRLGVKYVLNLAASSNHEVQSKNVRMLYINAEDRRGYDLLSKHFETCREFIKRGLEDGGVLVHCQAGVNRSVAIVAAYLISEKRVKLSRVLSLLKEKRGMVLTNTCFIAELVDHARSEGLLDL
uniref:protein-tyrosine-phosphatase n=1 Tax=Rhodosorus marinus TaxID=101924 RepID=A0A7S2ZRB3_9RHOD|mmetsp:Transcript_28263/g.110972  ORF Transcript_28263/g.110972 Transcript_28263/m.110972 type:complete len:205 (+) Transcript_28263:430-1044(+)|eukprot:CAMPEP_0113966080 /NCGR_PEP_ID=MMETSP0011_2-20120614/8124_1 /TAXON_ID=101924 /ORGANISM="Rhodosorus marinus" /LENGTH=204 /DNA_ID=CAMNT_0000978709 /DNA_START=352 /DNA_END=966 /DNA_ORIENTATION=+ /assembly_acc=CAM_ASM_000156